MRSNEDRTQVEFWNGRQAEARVVKRDRRRDLAVLQVEAEGIPPAIHGDSDTVRPGELAIAVGSPFGFTGAVSTGVIVHRVVDQGGSWIVSNVRLAPGNSGGPLANARGEVVGLNTMIAGGLALAIPTRSVEDFLARRPRLGVVVRPTSAGLIVLEITPGSPADKASLLLGDILVKTEHALPEGRVEIEFLRGADKRTRKVVAILESEKAKAA